MRATFATLFSGGGLFDAGAQMAGCRHLWGIEYDAAIAGVAHMNGFNVLVEDVRAVDYSALERPNHLHASPVCTRASVANAGAGEAPEDIEMAAAVAAAVEQLQPDTFSLENVWAYREFEAFRLIVATLTRNGYHLDYWHLNSADFAVPQTRRRLILLASKSRRPQRPNPTHREGGDMFSPAWVGWYEAISDLIPTLPVKQGWLPAWQRRLLPEGWRPECAVVLDDTKGQHGTRLTIRSGEAPFFTLTKRPANKYNVLIDGIRYGLSDRAMARLMSLPDDYLLPASPKLTGTVLGNGVPCLLARAMMEAILPNEQSK